MEQLYTVEQAAEILQVAPKTVRRWLQSRQLRGVLAGRFWRIQETDLKAFLRVPDGKSLETKPPAVAPPKAKRR
jgi:excisionase family DNA binding protein